MVLSLRRPLLEAEDWFRYDPRVRGLMSRVNLWRERLSRPRDAQALARSIRRLCGAARLASSERAARAVQRRIRNLLTLLNEPEMDSAEFVPNIADPWMPKACFLKPYLGPREKGVLFVSFENQWAKLLRHGDVHAFNERYHLVTAPSGDPHNAVNYIFAHVYPGPIFTLISNSGDPEILPTISPKFVVVPLYASHWVNPELYPPLPRAGRPWDLIMVANWAKFKRHFALFEALRHLPKTLRILLIGQDQDGRTEQTIREEARCYGVADRFSVRSNLPYDDIPRALGSARASVVLSRREGSCVVIAESLFADTPAAVLRDAQIGSRAFINPETGRLLDGRDLAAELADFLSAADDYRPRRWAEANLSCFRSSATLNAILKQHALASGQEWTRDLAPLCWRPDPELVRTDDTIRMDADRLYLRERFGLIVGPK